MKKLKPFIYLLLAVMLVPLASCDDDDDAEPSKAELLTAGEWTGFAVFVNGSDITAFLASDPDEPIDITTWKLNFNQNGTYRIQGDGIDPSPHEGDWRFTINEEGIILDEDNPDDSDVVQINRLTNNELFLEMTLEDDGTTFEGEVRFRR